MSGRRGDAAGRQQQVDRYFDRSAGYWRGVYEDHGFQGLIYRERMDTALRWVLQLELPAGAAALEVGCGAGLLSLALARAGLTVTATDSSAEMVERTRGEAQAAELGDRVRVERADVHALPLPSGSFDVAIALGLLPWLHDPAAAIAELARVLRPGGWLLVTADNRLRLGALLEPRENPLLAPLKLARRALRRRRQAVAGVPARLHRPREVQRLLVDAGLHPRRHTTIGYGPFTFLGRPILSDRSSLRVHALLTTLSARVRVLRCMGWHYLAAARK